MTEKKYIMFDIDDERIAGLADVLGNKTSKKIISYLSEKEASEAEISKALEIPANTVNYNIGKLLSAGLIEKSKDFFWSVKGKKVPFYKVANKKILISPKSSGAYKNILASFIAVAGGALLLKMFFNRSAYIAVEKSTEFASSGVPNPILDSGANLVSSSYPLVGNLMGSSFFWAWFLLGGAAALIIFMVLNWRKND
ncbi:winged helix-turn-helix transcriptional regulator [Candidatus Pacearchaeota archaeon]|nr:winged helix-turn-helix transcriptional regulator [Candidatus Pacearchaeota archaeon]